MAKAFPCLLQLGIVQAKLGSALAYSQPWIAKLCVRLLSDSVVSYSYAMISYTPCHLICYAVSEAVVLYSTDAVELCYEPSEA